MNDLTDQLLLREYAERRSEAAFTELVRRHIDLVYSAARRMTSDGALAEDVTQAVFVALAQNAARLAGHPVLSGWLHTTARNLAAKSVRAAVRRQTCEQEAAAMNQLISGDNEWEQVAPHLDVCLGELDEAERDVLLLRYFERKSASEIAAVLGISDAAAQKRVSRALERLRDFVAKRGVAVGAGGLAAVIGANAVQAAPVALAATVSTAALGSAAVSTTTIIATTTKAVAMTTLQKSVIGVTIAVLAGTGIFQARQVSQLREQNGTIQKQFSEQIGQLQEERDRATNVLAGLRRENAKLSSNSDESELLKLRGKVGALQQQVKDSEEHLKMMVDSQLLKEAEFEAHEAKTVNAQKIIGLCMRVWAQDNNDQFPSNYFQMTNELADSFVNKEGGPSTVGGIETSAFEFVNSGVTNLVKHPNAVLLRERLARQTPAGNWSRVYLFADGSVQRASSYDGNFEAWEKANTYIPAEKQP